MTDAEAWSPQRSIELYGLDHWGGGYFGVSDTGTVLAHPRGDGAGLPTADLLEIIEGLEALDLTPPVVLRFDDIIAHRMRHLRSAFDAAIAEAAYDGRYRCVYPIKVNQQRHICEVIRDLGAELDFGLEAGSKPELLAGLTLTAGHERMPLICNGFKDGEFIETVLLAAKMGRNVLPVIEQTHELDLLLTSAATHQVAPRFGIRAKLASGGVGRWASSVGFRGKFGLSVSQILSSVEYLREAGILDGLRMLHCHIGSQIFDIRTLKTAISELTHLYVEMVRLGAPMGTLDLGGGLGIDYDGSGSATDSSINYSLEQYANEIVYRVRAICDDAEVAHPDLITESGRALVAHSGVLVFQVLGSRVFPEQPDEALVERALAADEELLPQPLIDLVEAWTSLRAGGDPGEVFLDAEYALGEAIGLFNLGYADIVARAACEEIYWAIAHHVARVDPDLLPEELHDLPERVGDLYFSNFSLFQSLIDAWAIDQIFPVMPIHRLDEAPTRRGTLVDITCDSDGKLDLFPLGAEVAHTLPLHPLRQGVNGGPAGPLEPYYLGVFLTGAYQETLGDLHNLFGDTHAVHVRLDDEGGWELDEVIEGDTVRDVLQYVQFNPDEMRRNLRREIERAVRGKRLTLEEGVAMQRFLDDGIAGYTYLE
ncbi:MAG: biosynthetic arginine decarboxylase [Longimicrobiales bacterium]|nr:biosynthetic arginine decarboxylase [Longimicrobiales bacterium]